MKNIIIDNISTSYYITEDGKCYNSHTNKYLKGQINLKNGYCSYNLTMPDGSKKRCYTHRLVALAYLLLPDKYHKEVNHKDGNKLNNHISNLEWVTPSQNQLHALQLELRKYNHIYCFNKNKELIAEYPNILFAANVIGISANLIAQELKKDIKALTGGFYWSKEPVLKETITYKNTGKAKKVNLYDLNFKFINSYSSTGLAARALGLKTASHIGECCRGKILSYKGFIWRYADDIVSPSNASLRDGCEPS